MHPLSLSDRSNYKRDNGKAYIREGGVARVIAPRLVVVGIVAGKVVGIVVVRGLVNAGTLLAALETKLQGCQTVACMAFLSVINIPRHPDSCAGPC